MSNIPKISLPEIEKKLIDNEFPFSGITPLGSTEFHFLKPSFYAGIAMHAGHRVRKNLDPLMLPDKEARFREEDPHTERFIEKLPIQIIARDSRFEYDLNRIARRAIYSHEEEIWGMQVWKDELSREEGELSLAKHQEFHDLLNVVVKYLLIQNDKSVLFDMHSYCYQRERVIPWYKDPMPEINIGTKAVNRAVFGQVVDNFKHQLSMVLIDSNPIRIAENEVFNGGYLARRLSKAYPDHLLILAMEYKKIFMDELTGELFSGKLEVLVKNFYQAVNKMIGSEFFAHD